MTIRLPSFAILACLLLVPWAYGNGGPFVVKYPSGDPAAKGVLARLEPTLKPARETRLRVVKEDLTVRFELDRRNREEKLPPRVAVEAAYTIENPTDQEIKVDFGFPILRGIYLLFGMAPYPDVQVTVDKDFVGPTVISNSAIYGLIRQNAREAIEKGIAADAEFARRVAAVRAAWVVPRQLKQERVFTSDLDIPFPATVSSPRDVSTGRKPTADYPPARQRLQEYLTAKLGWNPRDAALLVAYASLEFKQTEYDRWNAPRAADRWDYSVWGPKEIDDLKHGNLGLLAAIGEQKATQMFAVLASQFDKQAGSNYEAIFAAWGGDVRERSLDLATGEIRPREVTLPTPKAAEAKPRKPGEPLPIVNRYVDVDPTVYARIDYLDPSIKLSPEDKASCEAVLKNLPVTFTFAPMNLLYYQAKFPAKATRLVTVRYSQYAYVDNRDTGTYQLAYVLHPATLWNEFGPIRLKIEVPKGIACRASAAIAKTGELPADPVSIPVRPWEIDSYEATLAKPEEKRGELFLALDKAAWDRMFPPEKPQPEQPPVQTGPPDTLQQSAPQQSR